MQIINRVMLLLFAATIYSSCSKSLEELNIDPNRPKDVTPGVILGQMQYRIVNAGVTASRNFTNELMQVDAPRASAGGEGLHRYVVNPGTGVWSNFYGFINDINDIYNIADKQGENNYKAIALVYKCWAYSILTDLYGDVPYSEATSGTKGNFTPAFDKQKDIYTQIFKDLDSANLLFNESRALTYGGDQVYAANALSGSRSPGIQRWRKFANSLKLRLLLRTINKDAELGSGIRIREMLADTTKYPVFSSNADEAIFRYPGTTPYFNPYFNARPSDWNQGNYYTKFFINPLNAWNDPRRSVWATTVTVNGQAIYRGIESGYTTGVEYVVDQNSSYSNILKTLPQLGVMMTYSELESIKAELALKGFTTGKTVRQHYETAIAASMTQWGVTLPAGYLQQAGVAYNAAGSAEEQLSQIMLQKYYAFNWVDYQSWFEKRRTGYPVLPRGAGIPSENKFPSRIPYPTYLQSLNPEGLADAVSAMGGDNSNIKVWWEK
jgi:hypothetical protein